MPVWAFTGVVGTDLPTMWRWLRTADLALTTAPTRGVLSSALRVQRWLERQHRR